ncbi:unnamed protein product, partial [Prorocentrum cordatum]
DMCLEYERISGLRLNADKAILVPLFRYVRDEARRRLIREAPVWGVLLIQDKAKYLGMVVGPGRGTSSWDAPCKKFVDRAVLWGQLGAGLLNTFVAYQVLVSSVVMFVAQLDPLPCSRDAIELQSARVVRFESAAHGGPRIRAWARQLHQLSRDAKNVTRAGHFQQCIDPNFFLSLRDATTELTAAERQVHA